jgi:phage major head subunit gpT-like protein
MIISQAALSGIYRSFRTVFNDAFEGAPSQWPVAAMEVPSEGRDIDYKWLGAFPAMREWIGERAIKSLEGFGYVITNKSFEATVEVDRDDIEDDQIGVYKPMIQGLAASAKQHPDTLVFALLAAGFSTVCYDGQYFFDTDHPVGGSSVSNSGGGSGTAWYLMDLSRPIKPIILQIRKRPEFVALDRPEDDSVFMHKKYRYGVDDRKNVGYGLWQLAYGSKQTLDATAYAAARAAVMAFKNDEGAPLGIVPTHLVVPPTLESAARSILTVATNAAGAGNPWYNTAQLVVVPWLA